MTRAQTGRKSDERPSRTPVIPYHQDRRVHCLGHALNIEINDIANMQRRLT